MQPLLACAQSNLLLMMLPILATTDSAGLSSAGHQEGSSDSDSQPPEQPQTEIWQGREWQRSDDGNRYTWEEAQTYCHDLTLDGHEDWQLPTWEELKSLVVCTNGTSTPLQDYPAHPYYCGDSNSSEYTIPTIDGSFQSHPWFYWSSSAANAAEAWALHFGVGGTMNESVRTAELYVRCVRTESNSYRIGNL